MSEVAVRLTADDLVTLNRASTVARLLSGVAHEVNNALLVIAGTAELLEQQGAAGAGAQPALTRIRSRAGRAAEAIAEVQAFVRASPAGRNRVDLGALTAQAITLRRFAVERAGHTITLSAPGNASLVVEGSSSLLQQAVLNLITNAEQALAGTGPGAIRVEIGCDDAGRRARLRVTDTGPGVAADDRERIFEPFVTGRSRSEHAGLGLPAVRRIAELHGGSATLEDVAPGASFVLVLPLAAAR